MKAQKQYSIWLTYKGLQIGQRYNIMSDCAMNARAHLLPKTKFQFDICVQDEESGMCWTYRAKHLHF